MGQQQRAFGLSQAGLTVTASRFTEQKPLFNRTQTRASNHTLTTARFLGSFPIDKKQAKVKDAIGRGSGVDFYRVELTTKSKLGLDFANLSNVKLTTALLDVNGAVVSVKSRQQKITVEADDKGDLFVGNLQSGTYYLQVKGAKTGQHNYKLNLAINSRKSSSPLPCGCET